MILSSGEAVAFVILGFPIYYYGLTMAFALLAGYFTANFAGKKFFSVDTENLFIPLIITGFLGARLYYCALNWGYYSRNLLQIFNFRGGGLSIHGGILAGALFLFFYCRKKNISLWQISAPLCIGLPLAQSIGRWGNFFNSEAFGKPFDGIIKLYVAENFRPQEFAQYQYFHPTFLYESIADIIIFGVLIYVLKYNQKPIFITCLYLALYSVIRIIIEFLRIDSVFSPFGIPIAVIISAVILIVSSYGLYYSLKHNTY